MPKKKATKRKPSKATKAKKAPARKRAKKAATPGHHLERAHHHTMKACPHVTKADLAVLGKLARAIEHATDNARIAAKHGGV